jgi:hydroxyacylglutathione hydrolase
LIHIVPILRDNYCYLLEGVDKNCIILDPGQVTPVESYISQHGLKPVLILNTHHHADHIAGNAELKAKYKIPVTGPKAEQSKIPHMDKGVSEGDTISESGIALRVIETPGHTKGQIVFYWADKNALFSGDTLFSMGCGRLVEGSPQEMFASLQKIKSLPPETEIYCGHEYTQANGQFALSLEPENADILNRLKDVSRLRINNLPTVPVTLETELKTNPFLRSCDENDFAAIRKQKDDF